jgi:hypothetical protein
MRYNQDTDPVIKFRDWDCYLEVTEYDLNGRTAILLHEIDDADSGLVAVATINIPDAEVGMNEVLIKDWSENEGMVEALQRAGVIGPVLDMVTSGYTAASKHELLI